MPALSPRSSARYRFYDREKVNVGLIKKLLKNYDQGVCLAPQFKRLVIMKLSPNHRDFIFSLFIFISINSYAQESFEVSDVLLDYNSIIGQEVTVSGFYLQMGEMAFLYEEPGSMTSLYIDSSGADRETRKYLLKNCGSGCNIQLTGKVANVMFSPGIILKSIK